MLGYTNQLEDNSTVIILKLKGTNSKGQFIKEPVEVKTKIICETCGRRNKSNNRYCSNCGTSLF